MTNCDPWEGFFYLTRMMYSYKVGPPGVLGIWGEWLFIFRELGSTGNYFRGAREQAHNLGDIGSLVISLSLILSSV